MASLLILFLLPFVSAAAIIFIPRFYQTIVFATIAVLAVVAVFFYIDFRDLYTFDMPVHWLFAIADFILILFFIKEGFRLNNVLVWVLGGTQFVLLLYLTSMSGGEGYDFIVDRLSGLMYLLINIVGGIISIYAIEYIKKEAFTEQKKRVFIAILIGFLGIMNIAVSLNSLELFFLFFELTTLASYLLISYRQDKISIHNGLKALWMNEVGGIALLLGSILMVSSHGTYFMDKINQIDPVTLSALPLAFLAIAAFVKGAQIPFNGWLLGAMVAPTPVSAMLHSATMVKIAPYLITRLSPAISNSSVFYGVVLLGGFTFLAAALLALEKEKFKEILAYSTISLLGLMIGLAAFGSTYAIMGVLMLIIFHGIAKALLFMQAGIYERKFGAKVMDKLQGLAERSPKLAFMTLVGFASITLPPFGAFLAKWYAREIVADIHYAHMFTVYMLAAITVGSALLTVLYFRVGGILLPKSGKTMGYGNTELGFIYNLSLYLPVLLLFVSAVYMFELIQYLFYMTAYAISVYSPSYVPISMVIEPHRMIFSFTSLSYYAIVLAIFLIFVPFIAFFIHLRGVDRAREYSCGEEIEIKNAIYFLHLSNGQRDIIMGLGGILFGVVLALGVFG